jgi:nicotinate phosphoribosyltransferase
MSLDTLGVDAYQLTTLMAHADAGRLAQQLSMSFFFRKLPRARNYVVFSGLRQLLEHAAQMRISPEELEQLLAHPLIGPALKSRPEVVAALRALDGFEGEIDGLAEGTLAFAGPARRTDGTSFEVAGAPLHIYTPLLQVRTDMLRAKLIETPWLGRINQMSMVASKAARVADAAGGKPVLEFGARRTHPHEAVDASYAAYIGGCAATSNMAAWVRWGVPATGTMDHFLVQSAERLGIIPADTERQAFADFARAFPDAATLLVDTYDTERGIREAVAATGGKLTGVRLDSNVNVSTVARARQLLDELGARQAKIFVSDGLDEYRVRELREVADGFGVGENITCVPDSAVGVGCVAKVVVNGYGKITMKISRGSGKATLPGLLQVYRYADHDLVALADEGGPSGGEPLLRPLWRGRKAAGPRVDLEESRAHVKRQLGRLPARLRALEVSAEPWPLVASDGLCERIARLVKEAGL